MKHPSLPPPHASPMWSHYRTRRRLYRTFKHLAGTGPPAQVITIDNFVRQWDAKNWRQRRQLMAKIKMGSVYLSVTSDRTPARELRIEA